MDCSLYWYHCKHIFGKKNGIANWPIEGKKKQNILHCCVHSEKYGRQIKKQNGAMETVILNKF